MKNVKYIGYSPDKLRTQSQIYTQQNVYKDLNSRFLYPSGSDTYAGTVNFDTSSLLAYYPFNGDLKDYSGNGYQFYRNTQFGGNIPMFIPGQRGKCLLVHNCEYRVGHTSDWLFGTGNFTVMFWMHVNNSLLWGIPGGLSSAKTTGFLSKRSGDTNDGWEVYNNGGNGQTGYMNFRMRSTDIYSTTPIQSNVWMHWAIVREGTGTNQTIMYLNGISDKTQTFTTNLTSTTYLALGKSQTYGRYCPGTSVQHLIIAKRAFSSQEILDFIRQTKN